MVLDHRCDGGVADQRRPQRSEPETAATALLDQTQRSRRHQQTLRRILRQAQTGCQRRQGLRLLGQQVEEPQAHAGEQHLRIDKTRHQIEEAASTSLRDRARQWEAGRPAPETTAADQAIAPGAPAIDQTVQPGRGRSQFGFRAQRPQRIHRHDNRSGGSEAASALTLRALPCAFLCDARCGPAPHAATRTTSSAIVFGTSRSASNRTSALICAAPGQGGMASMAAATRRSK